VVGWLLRALPTYPGNRVRPEKIDDGLYLDDEVGPHRYVKPRYEHRKRVARVVSVVGDVRYSLGRIDLVAESTGSWEPQFIGRQGDAFAEVDPWWVNVLEDHYDRGGDPVDLPLDELEA
jgi:hypothetical protein